ncbi:stage V sporulation protein E [Desulfotomaculum nigrificans CO-1-SRB]|uniref:Probable peptidoglycan glycosyltransferase FtsW n=1 Tax=Desulfotomaculum nigrificans (strain DSM 14880 / VKM B-2319 / CO-1-SRB) TaxID=868595 RepID=F6B3E7_DESCC|nr:stage V sporulation protein E [Desulfotomaculum nigrificans]AEF95178.1 stage V sporulation protein E [Desulfotomaculum nigrificans CO-1-SRB]
MRLKKRPPDFVLFLTVLMLLSIGLVMVFSASEYVTMVRYGDSFYFFKRQLLWALLGLTTMFVMMHIDYYKLKRWVGPITIAGFVLLIAVLLPGVGRSANGAQRWINLGFMSFSPAELVKLCLIIFVAFGLSKKGEGIQSFWHGLAPYLAVMGLAAGLILLQPDLGTAVVLSGTIFIMFFVAGARLSHLGGLVGVGLVAVALAIYFEPYRLRRFFAFLDPEKDPQGTGYHIIQSLYALGSGGLFGLGLGQSKQKFLYLPENHTDFIFAIVGEELGFIGATLIILLFIMLVWRGLKIAVTSPDPFASLLAAGITSGIALQAIINMGVVTGSMPVTGVPLPFISFGGTSLLFTLAGIGIILNISKYTTPR